MLRTLVAAPLAVALLTFPLIAAAAGRAPQFDYLELRLPAPPGGSPVQPTPFYLVFPDTLGSLAVREFLEAPRQNVEGLLRGGLLRGLSKPERHLLAGLRSLSDGRPGEAHRDLAEAVKGLPAGLKDCLRIDAALLLYLAGMPEEAEKEWARIARTGARKPTPAEAALESAPEEGAWRNLYSLYLSRRDFTRADQVVDAALEIRPGNRWASLAKGFLLRMLGTDEEWAGYLKDKSSWKDSLHGIQVAYGKYLADQGQWEEAVKYYNRGLDGAPGNGQAWLELADAYHRLGYFVFAEQCIQSAFQQGISDPYIFELYGKVLVDFGELADTSGVLRGLGFRLDTAWAGRQWRRAEKLLEEGFPKALHSRSMAQLLYRLYCRNGKVEAARNLREDFWFHFIGPVAPARAPRLSRVFLRRTSPEPGLAPRLSYTTFPMARKLQRSDFYEFF